MHKVGVIGTGFVGSAVSVGLDNVAEIREYDKYKTSESLYDVVNNSDILFVCVPTPMDEDGWCDTSIVEAACVDIDKNAEERKVIVIKSTVPPGTTQEIDDLLNNRHTVLFNPEFLREKTFIQDFFDQDRIFIGKTKNTGSDLIKVLNMYSDFAKTQVEPAVIREMKSEEAEMVKYVTNCFLATKVTFFNEMYDVCKALEIDFEKVKKAALMDERIGSSHTDVPGADGLRGFGGKCFPKDMQALIAIAQNEEVDVMLLESVWAKNSLIREKADWYDIKGATTDYGYEDEE